MDIIEKVQKFYNSYRGEKGVIGKSQENRDIYYFAVSKTSFPKIIFQYAIHAREYVTAYLALKHIKYSFCHQKSGTVYFIPLLNPDGAKIALTINPLYKSNARGVDLNVNFDARWGTGEKNVTITGAENCIGSAPFSERETKALRDFTYRIRPHATVSYHAKGEEIYYEFFQKGYALERDLRFASAVANVTGYAVKKTPFSAGGYKDWCIDKLHIPSLTIEVGKDSFTHPLKKNRLKSIYAQNKLVPNTVVQFITEELWI